MNLKENIKKILKEETKVLNTNTDAKVVAELNKHVTNELANVKSKLPKPKLNIIDPNIIINGVVQYFKSTIPSTLLTIKLGKGGDTFVYNTFNKLLGLIESELNNIGWVKKKTIQTFAPSKDELKKMLEESDEFDDYLQMFNDLVDFPFVIGWMDEVGPYKDNIWKFDNQKNEWLKKNKRMVKNLIIDKILNFIYS